MSSRFRFPLTLAVMLLSLLALSTPPPAGALGGMAIASRSTGGTQTTVAAGAPALSADGRHIAFVAGDSNLVSMDNNGVQDIFVRDTVTNTTVRVSEASDGTQASGGTSLAPAVSSTGRYVVFHSTATNLLGAGVDTNGQQDVFVRDRDTDNDGIFDEVGAVATRIISVSSANAQTDGSSLAPAISATGRYVAFASGSTNLLGAGVDTNGLQDIFVRDRDTDNDGIFDEAGAVATIRVSVANDGSQATGGGASTIPSISTDGRFVAFPSAATNLIGAGADTNAVQDVFVRDRDADADGIFDEAGAGATSTVRISVASDGTQGDTDSISPSISSNGRLITFQSAATTLIGVGNDTNTMADIFLRNRDTDNDGILDEPGAVTTTRISVSTGGAQGNGLSVSCRISADGRYVAFSSNANNLVTGDGNGVQDTFVRNTQTGVTYRVSINSSSVEGNALSNTVAMGADGTRMAFVSSATNLVAGDTNGVADVFYGAMTTPLPVTLISFEATRGQDGVALAWATATEHEVAGFRIWRGSSDRREEAAPISELIPNSGDGLSETVYSWLDAGAPLAPAFYWLEVINRGGEAEYFGPVTSRPGPADVTNRLFLPLVRR